MKKVVITFNDVSILNGLDDTFSPAEDFSLFLQDYLEFEVVALRDNVCIFILEDDPEISIAAARSKITRFLIKRYRVYRGDIERERIKLEISEYTSELYEEEFGEEPEVSSSQLVLKQTLAEIDRLVGAEEYKKLVNECVRVAPILRKTNVQEVLERQCYLFSINDGCGLSTYSNLLVKLYFALGIIEQQSLRWGKQIKIPARTNDSKHDPFSEARRELCADVSGGKNLIVFDISEWMTKVNDNDFVNFLSYIEDNQKEKLIIFRVPFVEKNILSGIKKGIGEILTVRDVSFVPFDSDEITEYAKSKFKEYKFVMADDAWEVFHARISQEKNDGRFYGINTIDKIVRETIYIKSLSSVDGFSKNSEVNLVIKKPEILSLVSAYDESDKSGFEILDDFIGMETIKQRVEEIVAQIEMSNKNPKLSSPSIHMRFVGNPGTGKTTVARVIGKILREKGILRNGNFFECSGRDLCGQYIGSTAPKTAAMCRDAYGSVLFIDEAYSLYRSEGVSDRDFGKEAIDTLIAEMENHRSDFVVIMAGYPDQMETLMKANSGLASRMPYVIEFPNYTREQLFEIFMSMVNDGLTFDEGFEEAVREYFTNLPNEVIDSSEFSNARFVRNLFERTCGKAAIRAQIKKASFSVLQKEDFLLATSEKEFQKMMEKQDKKIGFV